MKRTWIVLSVILIFSLVLAACNADGNARGDRGNRGDGSMPELYLTATADAENRLIPETGVDETRHLELTPTPEGWAFDDDRDDRRDDDDRDDRRDDDRRDDDDRGDRDDRRDDDAIPVTGERFDGDNRNLLALSELDGMPVYNRGGQVFAHVEGVVMNDTYDRVLYLIIDRDRGDNRLVAAPLGAFAFDEETRVIPRRSSERANPSERGRERGRGHQEQVVSETVLRFLPDENSLNDVPRAFDADDWRGYRGRMDDAHRYWADESNRGRSDYRIPVTGDNADVRWLDFGRLHSHDVYDRDGRKIGDVDDVIIDFETGEVRYLLVEIDGDYLSDARDRYLLVPADRMGLERVDDDDYRFNFTGSRDDLAQSRWVNHREDLYWDR
jgi:sporulation protein YlmC with PRC-barrel domain